MATALTIDQPAYFDRLADVEARHWWSQGMWQLASYWLDDALRGRRGLCALDLGCGTGLTLWRIAARPEIAEALGLDPSRAALAHARRLPLRWVRGTATALPIADNRVDVITCFDVLQHLGPDGDRRAVAEIHRVLRARGIALVRTNARPARRASPAEGRVYELTGLTSLLDQAGLRVLRASHANCLPAALHEARERVRSLGGASVELTPAGGGLRIQVPSRSINSVMRSITSSEALIAGRLGYTLPFGHSALVLAQKPGPVPSASAGDE